MSIGSFITEVGTLEKSGSMQDMIKIATLVGDPVAFKERLDELKAAEKSASDMLQIKSTLEEAVAIREESKSLSEASIRELRDLEDSLKEAHNAQKVILDGMMETVQQEQAENAKIKAELKEAEIEIGDGRNFLTKRMSELVTDREILTQLINEANADKREIEALKATLKSKIEEL